MTIRAESFGDIEIKITPLRIRSVALFGFLF